MRRSRAFTLIELLVVVSIIAVLAALLLPAVGLVKSHAQQAVCASNQRQIGLAISAYTGDNSGLLPWVQGEVRYWTHEDVLGQYLESRTTGSDATVLSGANQVAWCPAAIKPTFGALYARQALNCMVLPNVMDLTYWKDFPLARLPPPLGVLVACVDGNNRFFAGYASPPQCYGSWPGTVTDWSLGTPTSYANWQRRHRGGTNVLCFDGHVGYAADLRAEVQAGRMLVRR